MKKIVLINPYIYDFSAFNFWFRPLGLLYIASYLKKKLYNVEFIDCLDSKYYKTTDNSICEKKKKYSTYSYFKEECEKPFIYKTIKRNYYRFGLGGNQFIEIVSKIKNPGMFLITSHMTYWYKSIFEIINILKTVFPGIPIVLGGTYATLCFSHAKLFSSADYVFKNNQINELFMLIESIFPENKNIYFNEDLKHLTSLLLSNYPAFEFYKKNDFIPFISSKGCTYNCSYCASNLLYKGFDERTPKEMLNEIIYWKNLFDIKDVAFYDDALLINKETRLKPFLRSIIDNKININFHTPNGIHLKELDEETAFLMKESGFKTIRCGFETSNEIHQKLIGKKADNRDFKKAIEFLFKAGFNKDNIGVYIMMGIPFQTKDAVLESINFVKENSIKCNLCEYSPIPGTKLFEEALKETDKPLYDEPLFHNNSALSLWSKKFDLNIINELKLASKD